MMGLQVPSLLLSMACLLPIRSGGITGGVVKGFAYGPMPLKDTQGSVPSDDFFCDYAKPLWGSEGRGDLALMKKLGANTVRLYGLREDKDHTEFLDAAQSLGMGVIPGLSDYYYVQAATKCSANGYDCYSVIKDTYKKILTDGGFAQGTLKDGAFEGGAGEYHPALSHVIVANEPDLKLPGITEPRSFVKAIISAVDGMLDAEKEAGVDVSKAAPSFTVTFSYGVCPACSGYAELQAKQTTGFQEVPAIGQMDELRKAFANPGSYGYTARNDLNQVFQNRFTNTFNTANPYTDIPTQFLNLYDKEFPSTPVLIGEYHSPDITPGLHDQLADFQGILQLAEDSSNMLRGFNMFEWQVRYDKGGDEMKFGMFGLGDYVVSTLSSEGVTMNAWCLTPVSDSTSHEVVHKIISQAFGGEGIDDTKLCDPSPLAVALEQQGFEDIQKLGDLDKMATFIGRLVEHLGATVVEWNRLKQFASDYAYGGASSTSALLAARRLLGGSGEQWQDLNDQIGGTSPPSWMKTDDKAACVADRSSDVSRVGSAVGFACGELGDLCATIPTRCAGDSDRELWRRADYIFSNYYMTGSGDKIPMQKCYFEGAGIYAASSKYLSDSYNSGCVVTLDATTTVLEQPGYDAIKSQGSDQVAIFIDRLVADAFGNGACVGDNAELQKLAEEAPKEVQALREDLAKASWVCGGTSGRSCECAKPIYTTTTTGAPSPGSDSDAGSGAGWLLFAALVLVLGVVGGTVGLYYRKRRAGDLEEQQPAASQLAAPRAS